MGDTPKVPSVSLQEMQEMLQEEGDWSTKLILKLQGWQKDGKGIAAYRNNAMDSATFGQVILLTYGTPEAQIEGPRPPVKLPGFSHIPTHWAYELLCVSPANLALKQ